MRSGIPVRARSDLHVERDFELCRVAHTILNNPGHRVELSLGNLEHQLVDSMAMPLLTRPSAYDVIVTENLFGDILTDEAAALAGSLGVSPSASLGDGPRGLYEPIHGSAPDIAGQGVANPIGAILSAALLLRHSLGLDAEADALEAAVDAVFEHDELTRDLGGKASTQQVTAAVLSRLAGKCRVAA